MLTGPILAKQEDPLEAYIKKKQPIDLDAYLHQKMIEQKAKDYSSADSFGHGAAQGATVGFGDEIQGAVQAAGQKILPESMGGIDYGKKFGTLYKENRDTARAENEAAHKAHPAPYLGGELAGSIAPTLVAGGTTGTLTAPAVARTGIARILPAAVAAGQGAAQGAGFSNADTAGGVARDSALGGAVGLAGYGAGQATDAVAKGASGFLARLRASAAARAAGQAAKEESGKVASLAGSYGGEMQKGSRMGENLERYGTQLNPTEQAAADAIKTRVEAGTLKNLPAQAATIDARQAALDTAQQDLPNAIASRTAELSKPQIGKDAATFAKSYLEPLVVGYAADKAAEVAGIDPGKAAMLGGATGLVFGRTRAGKAFIARATRPGNVIGFADAGTAVTKRAGEVLKLLLQRAAPPIATQSMVTE